MRRMIVEDDLDSRIGRIGGIELFKEADELARTMAVFDAGVNLSREQVDPRQQAQCPMAFVFVVACNARMLIRHWRQVRRGVGDRLNARFLVVGDERDVWYSLVHGLARSPRIKSGARPERRPGADSRIRFGAGFHSVGLYRTQNRNLLIDTQD